MSKKLSKKVKRLKPKLQKQRDEAQHAKDSLRARTAGDVRWALWASDPALVARASERGAEAARVRWGDKVWRLPEDKLILTSRASVAALSRILKRSKPAIYKRRWVLGCKSAEEIEKIAGGGAVRDKGEHGND